MTNLGATSLSRTYKAWSNSYRKLIMNEYKKGKDFRNGVFYMNKTEQWEDQDVIMDSAVDFSVIEDGNTPNQGTIREGYHQTYTQVPYAAEFALGRNAIKFQGRDVKLANKAAMSLGMNAYLLNQKAPFSMLGYGFSSTNTYLSGITGTTVSGLGPDGKNLFSVVHPCSPNNSTTWSNALGDSQEVSEDALKLMIENLHDQLDGDGRKKHYGTTGKGYLWLVPLEEYPEALRITESELRPGGDENDINVYMGSFLGSEIEVRMVPWLGDWSETAHFLIAKEVVEPEAPMSMLTSEPFHVTSFTNDHNKNLYIQGWNTFAVGKLTGLGICGSKGDNSSYTS